MSKLNIVCNTCRMYDETRVAKDGEEFKKILRREGLCSTKRIKGRDVQVCPLCGSIQLSMKVIEW